MTLCPWKHTDLGPWKHKDSVSMVTEDSSNTHICSESSPSGTISDRLKICRRRSRSSTACSLNNDSPVKRCNVDIVRQRAVLIWGSIDREILTPLEADYHKNCRLLGLTTRVPTRQAPQWRLTDLLEWSLDCNYPGVGYRLAEWSVVHPPAR